MDRTVLAGCVLALLIVFTVVDTGISAAAGTRYFRVCFHNGCGSPDDYVIALDDPSKLQTADDILSGKIKDRVHIEGRIISQPADYNPGWKFHLDPASITFITSGNALCGLFVSTTTVEKNLDKVGTPNFLPLRAWCNVGLGLSAEVPGK